MHPEVRQNKPGKCPKCGMKLVLQNQVKSTKPDSSYTPLIVIVGLISLVTLTLTYRDIQTGIFTISSTIAYFMIGFFLTFSGFKLMDLKGFADGYFTYDLLAQRFYNYGYIYPFVELLFGLAMIIIPQSRPLLWLEFFVMAFSGLGVAIKLLKKEKFQCSCLGTFLKVPLTKVTLIEDFGMAILALLLLLLKKHAN